MNVSKKNIRSHPLEDIISDLEQIGEKKFRAKQVYEWIWKRGARSFDEMHNVSKKVTDHLNDNYFLDTIDISDQQKSNDGTIKCAFKSFDNQITEGVLIPTSSRVTACVSSQVGCSLACKFCATGRLKLMRNLTPGEIYDQVKLLNDLSEAEYGQRLTNIVFMGMGEPLLNYKNLLSGIEMICSENGLGFSPKRVTVSTAGIAKMITKLGDDDVKFNLALSLHAANDVKRSEIMEINDSNNLDVLAESLRYFYDQTGSRITFEYIIFKDFNDDLKDAKELADYCKNLPVKINIIEYNPIDGGEFQQADPQKVDAFANYLESLNLVVNVRRSRGKDIDAACGQLANKNKSIQLKERVLK
ncbi:23S rRNA (adenine(2503)-C(2))-methyltransferase RlmN [Paracrocinitomix mangrovi]|uniref:23S rRNA (adenine(2503)-C(2))-methyltransferase RlmN n=1 Tax=Paracrocinitomix mangrovi TaxID=2862509 RepID=UPI001C8E6607|nr:23S rRNA (adenine(2503)-C(2))-methyltransferase RlmN [Paracrocinitomix mangrovi]UKN00154.1 23S rRNA (adenine(2503)-C(2))-methyltransferase RlmN [Paracrocinitomix mangrovi]